MSHGSENPATYRTPPATLTSSTVLRAVRSYITIWASTLLHFEAASGEKEIPLWASSPEHPRIPPPCLLFTLEQDAVVSTSTLSLLCHFQDFCHFQDICPSFLLRVFSSGMHLHSMHVKSTMQGEAYGWRRGSITVFFKVCAHLPAQP